LLLLFRFFFLFNVTFSFTYILNKNNDETDNDNRIVTKKNEERDQQREKKLDRQTLFSNTKYLLSVNKTMATNASSETNKKANWFTRTFSSKNSRILGSSSSTDRINSLTNPSFISFSDLLGPRRTTENHSKQQQQQSTVDESLVDIAVNAESDISSLADKSRGTIDFFRTPPVS
jgi:hypothetical protein